MANAEPGSLAPIKRGRRLGWQIIGLAVLLAALDGCRQLLGHDGALDGDLKPQCRGPLSLDPSRAPELISKQAARATPTKDYAERLIGDLHWAGEKPLPDAGF